MTNALTDLVVELDGKVVGYLTESLAAYHKSLLARISVISAFHDDTNADNLRPMFSQVIILLVPGFQNCFPSPGTSVQNVTIAPRPVSSVRSPDDAMLILKPFL